MNIREIVAIYLKANGYDGLAGDDCGCLLDDLMPCNDPDANKCVAGHKAPCPGPEECYLDGDCDFHIAPGKWKEGENHV